MLAGIDMESTQHIVHATQFHFLSIDGSRPTGIIDFREHQHTTLTADSIFQLVGLVRRHLDGGDRVLLNGLAQHLLKLLVGHSLMAQVQLSQSVHLLVGVVHIRHMVHHPCITIGIGVLHRDVLLSH